MVISEHINFPHGNNGGENEIKKSSKHPAPNWNCRPNRFNWFCVFSILSILHAKIGLCHTRVAKQSLRSKVFPLNGANTIKSHYLLSTLIDEIACTHDSRECIKWCVCCVCQTREIIVDIFFWSSISTLRSLLEFIQQTDFGTIGHQK